LMQSNRYRHRIHTGRSLAKNLEGVGSKNWKFYWRFVKILRGPKIFVKKCHFLTKKS
jgi:hypothetical protein